MHVLHRASRSLATALLALAAGCGGDSTAPDAPFDPSGTSSDIAAVNQSFQSPAVEAYAGVSAEISAIVGDEGAMAVRAAPSAALLGGGKASALRYAHRTIRPSFSRIAAADIPPEYLGVTFVWDVETDRYVPSDDPGAPDNGVRFVLYAVNPITGRPIEPLVPIDGYADIRLTETSTSSTFRIVVVSSDITYLDYAVLATGSASSIDVGVSGFATNGTDRVNFDLDNRLTGNETAGLTLTIDYELVVPTRGGFLLDLETSISGIGTDTPSSTVDLLARGDHGTVTIDGTQTDASGSFDVEVNGDLFATITVSGSGATQITGATGQPLTAAEQAALEDVFAMFGGGFDFFEDLTDPLV